MTWLRALNAWFDRVPWYVDALACVVPGLIAIAVASLAWGWTWLGFLPLAVVPPARYLYHRRLPSAPVSG